jgi:hypothetical protein
MPNAGNMALTPGRNEPDVSVFLVPTSGAPGFGQSILKLTDITKIRGIEETVVTNGAFLGAASGLKKNFQDFI